MLKIYFPLPNGKAFAFVARCGTTSLAAACLQQFYPDLYRSWLETPNNMDGGHAHRLLPHKVEPELPPGCLVMIRSPLDRFASLCSRTGTEPRRAIAAAASFFANAAAENRNQIEQLSWDWCNHFRPVSTIYQGDSELRPLLGIQSASEFLGCSRVLCMNTSGAADLPEDVIDLHDRVYSNDIALWNSLS